jgi:diguanylate cyclase (GGDEF)-like protein
MFLPDQRTLLLVLALATFLLVVVMLLIARAYRQYPGTKLWPSAAALVCGGVVMYFVRGIGPEILTVVASNTFVIAGFALISHGVHLFIGRPSPRYFYWSSCLAVPLLLAIFNYIFDDLAVRIWIYCLAMGPLMLELSLTLHRAARGRQTQVYDFLALCFLIFGGYMFVRAGHTFQTGVGPSILDPGLMFSVNLLVHLFAALALTVGLPLMVSARLAADLEAHVADLRDEIGLRRQAEEQLAREAALDPLTGIYNRRKFFSEASKALSRTRRQNQPLSVLILDIDHFKDVNDNHGHDVGDRVLRAVADFCLHHVRAEDTLARFGGEEFVALMPDTDQEGAVALAERLRLGLRAQEANGDKGPVKVTASFGVSSLLPGETAIDAMLNRADQALYLAKQAGRDGVRAQGKNPSGDEA